jgi:hypothetical protein
MDGTVLRNLKSGIKLVFKLHGLEMPSRDESCVLLTFHDHFSVFWVLLSRRGFVVTQSGNE